MNMGFGYGRNMLRLYEDGSLGDSNGRIYAIAANIGQASRPPLHLARGSRERRIEAPL